MAEMICGVDEAGRGPLAGPVTASAVILPRDFPVHILRDSKRLSARQRDKSARTIKKLALDYGVGWCWPREIDRLNIHRATLLAMARAIADLCLHPDLILVDGKFSPQVKYRCESVVAGDTYVREIQAASFIAKTTRDLWMVRYARIESQYGFERHKGYPTKEHRALLRVLGPSPIHRRSFKMSLI